jgi:hypothetical protein
LCFGGVWVGFCCGLSVGRGVDEKEIVEAGYVEKDGLVVEEELGEEGEVLAEELGGG